MTFHGNFGVYFFLKYRKKQREAFFEVKEVILGL